jgi:hypothetical protein
MTDRSHASGRARRRDPRGPGQRADSPAAEQDPPGLEVTELVRRATDAVGDAAGPSVAVRGTLRRSGLGTHRLVLDADDGTTWALLLPVGWSVEAHPGARVTVSGDVPDDVPGDVPDDVPGDVPATSALGPVLRVRSLSARG